MKRILYAAYGSNLHPARLFERLGSGRLVGTSYLGNRGFRFNKRSVDESGKGNIVDASEGVYFAIYELDIKSKLTLDRIEGLGSGYNQEVLHLPGFGDCLAYVALESAVDKSLMPYSWYKQLVVLGCHYHRFPSEYTVRISSAGHVEDADAERHSLNMKLVRRIEHGAT